MRAVFADTGYWIALLNPRDALHEKAAELSRQLTATRIITTEMVLVEFLNSFSDSGSHLRLAAARLVEAVCGTPSIVVLPQTTEQFDAALGRYKRSADKSWSFTDCASFQAMENERLHAALTHDRHFSQAGYETLLR